MRGPHAGIPAARGPRTCNNRYAGRGIGPRNVIIVHGARARQQTRYYNKNNVRPPADVMKTYDVRLGGRSLLPWENTKPHLA